MRNLTWIAALSAASLLPILAQAQTSCEQHRSTRVVGTVAGAGIGALLGNAIAGHDNRTAGTVIGGLGGALLGNQITKPSGDCAHAYGYYDQNRKWHANTTVGNDARGYSDHSGQWVEGAPNGYYDTSGRWVAGSGAVAASGYRDSAGRWVPASSQGYYSDDGVWIAGASSGHYDDHGRWIAGSTSGGYDAQGRWSQNGQGERHDANGDQSTQYQAGYYDTNGHWRAGQARGYYDADGRWTATEADGDRAANDSGGRDGSRHDIATRVSWLDSRIHRDLSDGSLSRYDGAQAMRTLSAIRRQEAGMRHYNGRLSPRGERYIQARLDTLSRSLPGHGQDGAPINN